MLLSLINKATIFLHPEYIAAVKYKGILKRHISVKEVIALERGENTSDFSNVVESLKKLLTKPEWKNCDTQIILSGDFTKFRIVKWNDKLSQEEQKNLILNQLAEIYEIDGKLLRAFVTDNGFRKNNLAFAIEEGFYTALVSLENERLIKLNSILPYFALIANYWCKSIDKNAWLIIKEGARIYYAKLKDNSWEMIKVDPIKDDWEQETKRMLSRDMMQSGEASEVNQIYFHEEKWSSINLEVIKSIHQNVVILGRNAHKENNTKLLFANYLV